MLIPWLIRLFVFLEILKEMNSQIDYYVCTIMNT